MGVEHDHFHVLPNGQCREGKQDSVYKDHTGNNIFWRGASGDSRYPHGASKVSQTNSDAYKTDNTSDEDDDSSIGDSDKSDALSVVSIDTTNTSLSDDASVEGSDIHARQLHESVPYEAGLSWREDGLPKVGSGQLYYPQSLEVFQGPDSSCQSEPTWSTSESVPPPQGVKQREVDRDTHVSGLKQPGIARNRCRRASYESNGLQPPKLKRDTETSDCFVELLIAFTCRLITAIWPLAGQPPLMSSCFNGAGVLPLRTFVYETLRRSKTSYSTLQIALYYLIMLRPKLSDIDFTKEQPGSQHQASGKEAYGCRSMQCGRRMFLSALMLASKYIQDRNYSTRAWSKISGLRIPEINENERQYLSLIDYKLHLKHETFERWSGVVLMLSKLSKLQAGCHGQAQQMQDSHCDSDSSSAPWSLPSTQFVKDESLDVYSRTWWSALCKKLSPEIFEDATKTATFVAQHIPADQVDRSVPMPPILPNATHTSSDMTFSDPYGSRGPPSNVSTPVQMAAASPVPVSDMPRRPQLGNLQTPQSTPRAGESTSWVGQSPCNKLPRASASVDALRSLDSRRQAMNACLERCPPPQPNINLSQPRIRSNTCYNPYSSAGPSPPPTPERPQTARYMPLGQARAYRSRSSSISSNSSCTSAATASKSTTTSSYSASAVATPTSSTSELPHRQATPTGDEARCLRRKRAFENLTPNLRDEGYSRAEHPRQADRIPHTMPSEIEAFVAGALVDMRVGDRQSSPTPQPVTRPSQESTPKASSQILLERGCKQKPATACDNLQAAVQRLLFQKACKSSSVMEDDIAPQPNAMFPAAKQMQKPCRRWACPKKAILNPNTCKRRAMDCSSEQRQLAGAPELASISLRPDLLYQ